MTAVSEGDQLAGEVLLAVCTPLVLALLVLHFHHRHRHPIVDRSPALVLAFTALTAASVVLLLLFLVLSTASAPLCWLSLLSLSLTLLPSPLLLLLRSLVFLFRLELTAELERFHAGRGEEKPSGAASRKGSVSEDGDAEGGEQPSPHSSGLKAETSEQLRSSEEGLKEAAATAAGLWWVDHRRLISAPFLSAVLASLTAVSTAAILLLLLVDRSDTVSVPSSSQCPDHSPPFLGVRVAGFFLFVLHSAVLCASSFRHPSADGLRAEAALTVAAVVALLPLSFALPFLPSLSSASQYVFLSFQLLLLTASVVCPLLSAHSHSLHSRSLAELSSIQSFHDLIRNPVGFDSFHAFVKTEFSEENLLFWQEVEALQTKALQLEEVEAELQQRKAKEREAEKAAKEEEERQLNLAALGQQRSSNSLRLPPPTSPSLVQGEEPTTPRSQSRRVPRAEGLDDATASSSPPPQKDGLALLPLRLPAHPPTSASVALPTPSALNPALQSALDGRRRRNTSGGELSLGSIRHRRDPAQAIIEAAGRVPAGARSSDSLRIPTGSSPVTSRPRSSGSTFDEAVALASHSANFPPFPPNGSWDVDAVAKLRRISWSIALDRKAQRRRTDSHSRLTEHKRARTATLLESPPTTPTAATHSPNLASPPTFSSTAPITVLIPAVSKEVRSTKSSPRAAPVQLLPVTTSSPSPVPTSPLPSSASPKVTTPFMQSIVRALQATKLASAAKWVDKEEELIRRLSERQAALHVELLQSACDIVDRHVAPHSVAQVNLPDVLVQQVMERMKEVNPVKYATKPKLKRVMSGGHGMQHTLGLMRHATIHFLAKGKVSPFPDRTREHERQMAAEAERRQAEEDLAMVRDLSLLSFPITRLFADAQAAIQQLMEKDSFKRYLTSPAFDDFTSTYARRRGAASVWVPPVASRQGSRSRIATQTPRATARRELSSDVEEAVGATSGRRHSASSRVTSGTTRALHTTESQSANVVADGQQRQTSLVSSQLSPRALALAPSTSSVSARPPSPMAPASGAPAPTVSPPSSHALSTWSGLHKLALPIVTARAASGSVILAQQLSRTRPALSKVDALGGGAAESSPKRSQQRTVSLAGEGGATRSSPQMSRRAGVASMSMEAEGIEEEAEDGVGDLT